MSLSIKNTFINLIPFAIAFLFTHATNVSYGPFSSLNADNDPPIAEGKFKFLGNVYSYSQLPGFGNYWNQVTPENAGKWGSVESVRDQMNWTVLDEAYEFAKENDFYFKFHVLVWGNQQPSWIEDLSHSEQLEEIIEWFSAVGERYPEIDAIEVVNEPINDPPNQPGNGGGNYINALGGTGATGYDWIIKAFELAREYFPNAKLMINEYSIINDSNKLNTYKHIITLLKDRDLIDQVGFQAHAFNTGGSVSTMSSNLNKLAELDLPIFVTEMDIDGPSDQVQLEKYQEVFPLFWEHPSVKGITLWGYRPGMWRTEQKAYLIEEDGVTERPALQWLRMYVENTTLKIKDAPLEVITVFPNPISGSQVHLKGLNQIDKAILYDINGNQVQISSISYDTIHINQNLNQGIYFLNVISENREFQYKLVVNK